MKTQNTPENKAKFLAASIGCQVEIYSESFTTEGKTDSITDKLITVSLTGGIETTEYSPDIDSIKVLKKELLSMTDAESVEMAKIALYHPDIEDWDENEVWVGEGDFDNSGKYTLEIGMRCWEGILTINDQTGSIKISDEDRDEHIFNSLKLTDFLRSQGYLIGWMDLTPEDLIEYGWVKLKS